MTKAGGARWGRETASIVAYTSTSGGVLTSTDIKTNWDTVATLQAGGVGFVLQDFTKILVYASCDLKNSTGIAGVGLRDQVNMLGIHYSVDGAEHADTDDVGFVIADSFHVSDSNTQLYRHHINIWTVIKGFSGGAGSFVLDFVKLKAATNRGGAGALNGFHIDRGQVGLIAFPRDT